MKFKHLIIGYLIAWSLRAAGATFKVQSWLYGSELLVVGTFLLIITSIVLVVKLAFFTDADSILNK